MSRAIRVFLNRELLIGVVIAIVVSIVVAPSVARRFRIVRPAAYVATLSTMLILAITIFQRAEGLPVGVDLANAATWWTKQRASVIDIARTEPGWWLNVVLFVPAGLIWSGITRRPLVAAAWLGGFSFGIETLQGLIGFGAADFSDLVANSLGGVLGAMAVAVVLSVAPRLVPDVTQVDPAPDASRLDPKWVLGTLGATALVAGAGLFGVQAVLATRQAALRHQLEEAFEGLTLDDVNEIRNLDPVSAKPFFQLVSVRPDSYQFHEDDRPVNVRYPVDFLGAYRCVFVELSESPPVFTNGRGKECTEDRSEEE